MYELKVKSKFSSAHFLREYEGKCENLHGHNWKVEVVLRGKNLNKIGLLIDFKKAKKILNEILNGLDHKLINDLEFFKTLNPSCENLAKYLHDEYFKKISDGNIQVYKIIIWETDEACASYMDV